MFHFLHSGDNNSPYLTGLLVALNTMHTKCLAQDPTLSVQYAPVIMVGFYYSEDENRGNQGGKNL